jgi:hypothetical protein
MYVAQQRKEVLIDIDELGFIASLDEVTCGSEALVPIARIAHANALHRLAKRLIGYLDQGVQMIRHPAERVDTREDAG